ncbi:MAG: single-stranded DNA-binding protein [Clostridia bacterium]|nr:single-stranded DNA-binding protein [Clostridia bacterium]
MSTNFLENNHLVLVGKIVSEQKYSHEIYGEKFYSFNLEVVRLSNNTDIIPITVSERLLTDLDLSIGREVEVEGQFRSYNNYENEKNRLILTVFAKEIKAAEEHSEADKDFVTNEVILVGYVCKKPIYRQTPFGREIADLLLAVNRAYNKSDYIPCIAWGRNARFCQKIEVGTEVKVVGRVQSRTYEKKYEDGTAETRIAYEVSIASMEICEKETDNEEVVENNEEIV